MFPHSTRLYGIIQPGLRLPCAISYHPPFPGRIGSRGQARPGQARPCQNHGDSRIAVRCERNCCVPALTAAAPIAPIGCRVLQLHRLRLSIADAAAAGRCRSLAPDRGVHLRHSGCSDAVLCCTAILPLVLRCFRLSEDEDALSERHAPATIH